MEIPIHNTFDPKDAKFVVDIYPKTAIRIESVRLSTNESSNLSFESKLKPEAISTDKTEIVGDRSYSALHYSTDIHALHPLLISESNQTHLTTIIYRNPSSNASNPSNPIIVHGNFFWLVRTWDLGNFNYFWVIFSGVLLSRIFPLSSPQDSSQHASDQTRTGAGERIKLKPIEFVWVPFSAIITLLIFSSFKSQVQPTTDIISNIAMAFGFGFGFDKVLNFGHRV
jgi:hypothetical protein